MRRRIAVALALLGLAIGAAVPTAPILAADPSLAFDAPSVEVHFPDSATWTQSFASSQKPTRVELVSRLDRGAAWFVRDVPFQETGTASNGDGQYRARLSDAGTALPNSLLRYHFRVTTASGAVMDGPDGAVLVTDDRSAWQALRLPGSVVRLHWHTGDKVFASRALRIADDAIAATSKLLGVTETEPIDFFVYDDSSLFRSALPGVKEFVAGLAVADIRTLFAVIQPSDIGSDWVQIVIPHELTHLVFDTATSNPYRVPPHWLNEGLAVYLSEGYTDADRQRMATAIQGGTLLPLQAIEAGFPPSRQDLFYQGYAEGVSAIDFFKRRFGELKLVQLIRSYAAGVTDDEAFKAATGLDMAGFEAAWLDDIGAAAPKAYGPAAPVPGPTPASWIAGPASSASPRQSPAAGSPPPAARLCSVWKMARR